MQTLFGFGHASVHLMDTEGRLFSYQNREEDVYFDKPNDILTLPSTLGLTGKAVESKKGTYSNFPFKESRYN